MAAGGGQEQHLFNKVMKKQCINYEFDQQQKFANNMKLK